MSSSVSQEDIQAGHRAYTKTVLRLYDALVLGASCSFLWKCPASVMLDRYQRFMSPNHLEVGAGTGYFPAHARPSQPVRRLALMDLNENCLAFASSRVSGYRPDVYVQNALEPMRTDGEGFESVGMNLLLHCLPGGFESKGIVFDHVSEVMLPGAVIFGATLLGKGTSAGWASNRAMKFYNWKGIFSNSQDGAEGLRSALAARFESVEVETRGCMALFSARKASAEEEG